MSKYCIVKDGPALYLDCKECHSKECEFFYCLVVGSRDFCNYNKMRELLDMYLSNWSGRVVIVSGGAKGADSLAEKYAKDKGYLFREFPADWNAYGKQAGYIRNEEMHKYISKAKNRGIVAFWNGTSKGTAQNFGLAKKYNNPIRIVRYTS